MCRSSKGTGATNEHRPRAPIPLEMCAKEPKKLLDRRMVKKNNQAVRQVLIKSMDSDKLNAISEKYLTYAESFPNLTSRTKLFFKGKERMLELKHNETTTTYEGLG